MAPHTITHCINDDTSRHSRDIKYQILMNIKFLSFPKCVSSYTVITFAKKRLTFIYTFK